MAGFSVVVFAGGALAGFLLGLFLLPSPQEVKRLQAEIEDLETKLAEYKDSVTDHFRKTSQLVGEMTRSYKAVYDHLATGARELCDAPPTDNVLEFSEQVVLANAGGATASVDDGPAAADGARDAAARDGAAAQSEPSVEASLADADEAVRATASNDDLVFSEATSTKE